MKKISLFLNILLSLAVIFLYVLYFIEKPNKSNAENNSKSINDAIENIGDLKIAYVQSDSIMANYLYYAELKSQLETKQKQLQTNLAQQEKEYLKFREDAIIKVQKGLVTSAEAQQLENLLREKEQKYMENREKFSQELAEEEMVLHRKLINNVNEYLNKNYKGKGVQMILSHQFADNILYINDSMNITSLVIDGLNNEYNALKSEK